MTSYSILQYPSELLRRKALSFDFERSHDALSIMIDKLFFTLKNSGGIALSAPQVGLPFRIVVIAFSCYHYVLINPVITYKSDNHHSIKEGCLSLSGFFAKVSRPKEVEIEYLDIQGDKKKLRATGLLSSCIQHEIDHLNGVLFIDRIDSFRKNIFLSHRKI